MSATATFWKRLEGLFHPNSAVEVAEPSRRVGFLSVSNRQADIDEPHPPSPRPNGHAASSPLAPWARWRQRGAELRENYIHTAAVIDAIHGQLAESGSHAKQLGQSVGRIHLTLETIAEKQTTQADLLARICDRLDGVETHAEKLATAIRELPPALRSQADAVQAVSSQLEASRTSDARLMDSLKRFEHAVAEIRESGAVQVDTLNRLQMDHKQDRGMLEQTLLRQNRRFVLLTLMATLLSLAAITSLLMATL
jgi:hypothetical protein